MHETSAGSMKRRKLKAVVGGLSAVLLLGALANVLTGYGDQLSLRVSGAGPIFPDAIHERAVAWEALFGDPHRPLGEILSDHGYDGDEPNVSPRPPSALLLQTSILIIPIDWLIPMVTTLILFLLVWIGWLTARISGISVERLLWASPIIVVTAPVVLSLAYSPLFGVTCVALVLGSWAYRDRPWAGLLLGLAMALRIWPGLIAVGLWLRGDRRPAYQAIGSFLVLNLVGLLLPGVTAEASLSTLLQGAEGWIGNTQNASFAAVMSTLNVPVFASTAFMVAVGLWVAVRKRALMWPVAVIAALLASPLSWPTYALAAAPAAALYARSRSYLPVMGLAALSASWRVIPPSSMGRVHFLVLAVLLLLLVRLDSDRERRGVPGYLASPDLA